MRSGGTKAGKGEDAGGTKAGKGEDIGGTNAGKGECVIVERAGGSCGPIMGRVSFDETASSDDGRSRFTMDRKTTT